MLTGQKDYKCFRSTVCTQIWKI